MTRRSPRDTACYVGHVCATFARMLAFLTVIVLAAQAAGILTYDARHMTAADVEAQ